MKYFKTYISNTLAGSGNQFFFLSEKAKISRGRIYYKIFSGGTYQYSLLFSNIIDSTYADGMVSYCNLFCNEWKINDMSLGICKTSTMLTAIEPEQVTPLTFNGSREKRVMPGEFFTTDPVELSIEKGNFLCLELSFSGTMLPYHEETMLPTFVMQDGNWVPCKYVPFAGMIGCNRRVEKRIGFLGDSITQGIGTPNNKYTHWNALVADALGDEYSYWNLGLGYGRAADAASDGAWLSKAKQLDVVIVCLGTNDVGQNINAEKIKRDLYNIVLKLKEAGVKVLIQTLPPFNRKENHLKNWLEINRFIREELKNIADAFLDVVPFLVDGSENNGKSKFNEHPNEEGCELWAQELIPILKSLL